jgi:hypothetical protein
MTLFKTVRAGQGGQLKTKYVYYTDDLSNFEKAKAIWLKQENFHFLNFSSTNCVTVNLQGVSSKLQVYELYTNQYSTYRVIVVADINAVKVKEPRPLSEHERCVSEL